MESRLPAFENGRVLLVGDVMLDRYWSGLTQRISPEAPVPVVLVNQHQDRPGGAANVAFNMATLGCNVYLKGIIGEDEAGKKLLEKIDSLDVKADMIVVPQMPTIVKLRVLSAGQQLIRLDFEQPYHAKNAQKLIQDSIECLSENQVLVLSDYAKGSLVHAQELIQAAKKNNLYVVVDSKGNDYEAFRDADLLTPNLHEFESMVGRVTSDQDLQEKALHLIRFLNLQALLVTRSEQGMTLIKRDAEVYHYPTHAQEVFDVTGAGDTVVAVIAASIAAGADLQQACYLANVAAGLVVGKLGTSTVTSIELAKALNALQGNEYSGVVSQHQMLAMVGQARLHQKKIVMTNGCFDLLHAGHVQYLKQAKALGDILIIAVNSDESVRQLKGKNRPINDCKRRMSVLAGLSVVDFVCQFEEDTPLALIQLIQPDVLVKGGDYVLESIVGYDAVQAYGGQVRVLGFHEACSTSGMIEAIIEQGA
ncbi:MAG: bifunctional D-glycero-beta-D-manno-heptose-7-phosphate kinase/D-glycero-beta-D-manno-heptose 1-phosphate adenylyltransferase HldE [Shewanellaceae bacterium]|nr:bifunctional D-glycero-beta-D-manno-heptose-7-phosphate kinase/D-glycero-beta-D-manno-heptose 1-phosphate adenylyltransferase HldE [Shewanellaceae bacterium]